MHALVLSMVLAFGDGHPALIDPRVQEIEWRNFQIQEYLRRWKPEQHVWTLTGIGLSALSTAGMFAGAEVIGADPNPSGALIGGWVGFDVGSLLTAIGMVVYNAGL
jgi:hypothetical protein